MSVIVTVNFRASDGNADALLALLQQGRDVSRTADGCESFDLYRREDDPQRFTFFERWTSIDAHHANMADNIVATGHLAKMLPLLDGGIDNGVLQLV
jgi:quinol monooxygenase YgiN